MIMMFCDRYFMILNQNIIIHEKISKRLLIGLNVFGNHTCMCLFAVNIFSDSMVNNRCFIIVYIESAVLNVEFTY